MDNRPDWTEEHNDWANQLDKISSNISDKSSDLREDTYGTNRASIIKALEKYKSDLDHVIGELKKL